MIYELWLWKNNPVANAAIEKMTPEEEKAMDQAFNAEAMARYGAGWVLYCSSSWANDAYRNWGVTTYKSIEQKIEHTKIFTKAGWYRFAELYSILGTLDGAEPSLPDYPNPIYELWMVRNDPVTTANFLHLSKEEEAELRVKHAESEKRTGAHMVLYCKSAWANEEYSGFGVTAFPNIEACQQNRDDLDQLNWSLYFNSFSMLGIVEPSA